MLLLDKNNFIVGLVIHRMQINEQATITILIDYFISIFTSVQSRQFTMWMTPVYLPPGLSDN